MNMLGNRGWVQSIIDKSRGKRRPGERDRDRAATLEAERQAVIKKDMAQEKAARSKLAKAKPILPSLP